MRSPFGVARAVFALCALTGLPPAPSRCLIGMASLSPVPPRHALTRLVLCRVAANRERVRLSAPRTAMRARDARVLRLDVVFSPTELAAAIARVPSVTCAAIDVLRATTTLAVMGERAAARVILAPDVAEARALAAAQPGCLLAGEVDAARPPGFDFGNSPAEVGTADLAGRTIIFATTNGTRTLRACVALGARATIAASLRNATAVADSLLALPGDATACLVAAGRLDRVALDDAVAAGIIARIIRERARQAGMTLTLTEPAELAILIAEHAGEPIDVFRRSDAGRAVLALGLEADLAWSAALDATRVVPRVAAAGGELVAEFGE